MMDLKNKIVVITGATNGLGACLAQEFAEKGSKVISLSRGGAKDPNPNVSYISCDITDKEKVFNVIGNIGDIDIFINNAGIWFPWAPIEDQTREYVQKMFDVNFFGTMFCSQAVLPVFKAKGSGTFVNVISTSALVGRALSSGYASSKFAQDGFTKSLKVSCEGLNIKVINTYPDGMKTDIFGSNKPDNYDTYMDPKDVAKKIIDFVENEKGEEIIIKEI